MLLALWTWFVETLRAHPELTVFLALGVGFGIGPRKVAGFALGSVTATLLAGVVIGQLGITVDGPIKSAFFLLFLFAVGYGVGPQFFSGIGKEGPKQIVFSLIVLAFCLLVPVVCAWIAGLDVGYAAGLYAGSQTISASIGVASDQIARLGLTAAEAKAQSDAVPIGYAVTYIFGTIGSAVLLAQLGPKLIGVDLPAACAEYERQMGGVVGFEAGVFSAYRAIELRAYAIDAGSPVTGRPVRELFPDLRIFVERVRRGDRLIEADGDTVLQAGDVAAISGPREALIERVERGGPRGRRHRTAERARDGRRRLRHEQGDQRQDAARAGRSSLHARRLPAADHPTPGGDSRAAGNGDPARGHPDARRQHPPHRRGRRCAGLCRSPPRGDGSDDRRCRDYGRRPWSAP